MSSKIHAYYVRVAGEDRNLTMPMCLVCPRVGQNALDF
jgi:hypothetical protein